MQKILSQMAVLATSLSIVVFSINLYQYLMNVTSHGKPVIEIYYDLQEVNIPNAYLKLTNSMKTLVAAAQFAECLKNNVPEEYKGVVKTLQDTKELENIDRVIHSQDNLFPDVMVGFIINSGSKAANNIKLFFRSQGYIETTQYGKETATTFCGGELDIPALYPEMFIQFKYWYSKEANIQPEHMFTEPMYAYYDGGKATVNRGQDLFISKVKCRLSQSWYQDIDPLFSITATLILYFILPSLYGYIKTKIQSRRK